jgi:hypothetical protein
MTPQVTIYQPRWAEEDYRRRPKDFDPDITLMIIERVMNGETLNALCANNRDYPLPGTFLLWLEQEPDMAARYRRAKTIQTELLVDGMIEDGKAGTWDAGTRVMAGRHYVEKTDPARYGPRATIFTPPPAEPDVTHAEVASAVKVKINQMADRMAAARRKAEQRKNEDAG